MSEVLGWCVLALLQSLRRLASHTLGHRQCSPLWWRNSLEVCGAVILPLTQHLSGGISEVSRSLRHEAQNPGGRYKRLQVCELLPGV
ncbi:hypothetical protein O3P69_005363 [Scylla paramamosain]|uniref:Secreted protein n=1 Tax=Scylla paramamosain TaxID=85552 RepID=A0AAW0U932_SCYPA